MVQKGSYSNYDLLREIQRLVDSDSTPKPSDTVFSNTRSESPKLLVIDDDPKIHDLMTRHLTKEGFEVIPAFNGKDGLRLAREIMPLAITLDVLMPDMDGWTVLTSLKSDPGLSHIPVIMLTVMDEKNLGFTLGAVEYLNKPVNKKQLISVLSKYKQKSKPDDYILVIEDDAETRFMLRRMLEKEGLSVKEAENGKIGLEMATTLKPSFILLDLMMPVMDGFEFLAELRAIHSLKAVPVVVVTAKDLTAEEGLQIEGSVNRIVQKGSFSRDDLLREVQRILQSHTG